MENIAGAMTDVYAVMPVKDRIAADEWYARFFGRPADHVIGEESLWQVTPTAYIVIDDRRRFPGTAEITLGVTGLDALLAGFAENGIEHEPVETYGNSVRHVTVRDPDGNELSFAEAPVAEA